MTDRWWAPTRPTVDPDAVVLALMEPDGDPAGDLGASLLGLHRAGAAACDLVAKAALPSEQGLSDALMSTSLNLRSKLVESVSKSLEPSYAGLLVRDVCNDADSAAVDLYRACVAKGISPPMAVSRVGAVYGVPAHDLGKYRALALDRKSNPAELTDAADRCLLSYVSKLVRAEVGEAKEAVSKAPTDVLETEFDPQQAQHPVQWNENSHPRGTGGQFTTAATRLKQQTITGGVEIAKPGVQLSPMDQLRARLGLLENAPAVVVEPDEPAPGRATRKRPSARKRSVARAKKTRARIARQQVQPVSPASQKVAAAKPKMGVSRQKMRKASLQAQAISVKLGMTKQFPAPAPLRPLSNELVVSDPMRPYDETDQTRYEQMSETLLIHVDAQKGLNLLGKMQNRTQDGMRLFRFGYLRDLASDAPVGFGDIAADGTLGNAADAAVENVANQHPGYVPPHSSKDDSSGNLHTDQDEISMAASLADAQRWRDDQLAELTESQKATELLHMVTLPSYYNEDERVVVHDQAMQDTIGRKTFEHSPSVMVDEFVVDAGAHYRGIDVGTVSKPEVRLDPNQVWQVKDEPVRYWDQVNHVVVNRYFISPAADNYDYDPNFTDPGITDPRFRGSQGHEGVEKAEALTLEYTFDTLHPRGAGGQFETKDRQEAPTATPMDQLRARLAQTASPESVKSPTARRKQSARTRSRLRAQKVIARRASLARTPQQEPQESPAQAVAARSRLGVGTTRITAAQQRLATNVGIGMADAAKKKGGRQLPEQSDINHFTALTDAQFRSIVVAGPYSVLSREIRKFIDTKGTWMPFSGDQRRQFLEHRQDSNTEYGTATAKMVDTATQELMYQENQDRIKLGDPFEIEDTPGDQKRLGTLINNAFDDYDVDQITAWITRDGFIQLTGNAQRLTPQILVQVDPQIADIANDPNLVITNMGNFRTKNVLIIDDADTPSPIITPWFTGQGLPYGSDESDLYELDEPGELGPEPLPVYNLPVQIFRVTAARMNLANVTPQETEGERT